MNFPKGFINSKYKVDLLEECKTKLITLKSMTFPNI